jgi:mannosyltransferase OCH1-like enzyme
MIPKIIHYCWFGRNELPPLAKRCIASWQKFFPDYEIKEWNEDNFDVNAIPFTKQAYKHKKYAFVSDYARFKIIYEWGGIYFDTDVEIIKPMNDIINSGPYMGLEIDVNNASTEKLRSSVNPGLGFAAQAGHPFIREMLYCYEHSSYKKFFQKTITEFTSELLLEKGFSPKDGEITDIAGFKIYPKTFFQPISSRTKSIEITNDTRSIHHYVASWISKTQRFADKNRYFSLLFWLLRRPVSANIKGLIRVIKERNIWD